MFLISPIPTKIYKFPPNFVQFTFLLLTLRLFGFSAILTMMHLCIMVYTYLTCEPPAMHDTHCQSVGFVNKQEFSALIIKDLRRGIHAAVCHHDSLNQDTYTR